MHQLAYLPSYSRTHAFIHPATHSSTCPHTHQSIHTSYPKPQPIHPPTNCIFIPVLQAAAVYKQGAKRGLFLSQYQPTMVFHFCFTGSCCVQTRSRARTVPVSIPTYYSFSFLFYRQLLCTNKEQSEVCFCLNTNLLWFFISVLQAAAVYKQSAERGLSLSQYQPTIVFHSCFTGSFCVQTRSRARSVSVSIPTNYSFSFLFYRQQGAERGLFLSKYQHTIVFHSCFTCSCCVQTRSRGRTVSVSIPTDYSFSFMFYRQLLCTNKEQSEVCFCLNTNQLCIFIPVLQAAAVYRQGAE